MKTTKEMIREWLVSHQCDGLRSIDSGNPCGCTLDDFMPCTFDDVLTDCVAAVKQPCNRDACLDADWCDIPQSNSVDFCLVDWEAPSVEGGRESVKQRTCKKGESEDDDE